MARGHVLAALSRPKGGPSEHSLLKNIYNSQKQFAFHLVCLAATRTATDSLAADNAID